MSNSHCSKQKIEDAKYSAVLGMGVYVCVIMGYYGLVFFMCILDLQGRFSSCLLANSQTSGNHNSFPAVSSK